MSYPLSSSSRCLINVFFNGSLLFATTNHIDRLDPALSRPGRMDVWVNFTHATRFQAEGIFKCFFPSKPSANSEPPSPSSSANDASQKNLPLPKRKNKSQAIPLLDEAEISVLAKRFADAIPEDELSVCERKKKSFVSYGPHAVGDRLQAFKVTFSRTRRDRMNVLKK